MRTRVGFVFVELQFRIVFDDFYSNYVLCVGGYGPSLLHIKKSFYYTFDIVLRVQHILEGTFTMSHMNVKP